MDVGAMTLRLDGMLVPVLTGGRAEKPSSPSSAMAACTSKRHPTLNGPNWSNS